MRETLFILTGASRGMGAAMAEQILQPGVTLLCLSRGAHGGLAARAAAQSANCTQWAVDLANPQPVAERLVSWLDAFEPQRFAEASLINNAGVIARIGPVDEADFADLSNALRVGLEATLLLSAAFLRGTRSWAASRRVLNVSSGLGRRAMAGSASYCAAKAGMDHLTRAMALDEATRPNPARVVSLAPGVIDTDMQTQLRAGDEAVFPDKPNFVRMKEGGQLSSPTDAARRVLAFLGRADFGQQPVADVREA